MIRRSGVRPLTYLLNDARVTPRLAASGNRPSRQFSKLAAAARMAEAVICGWPEAPSSPDHSRTVLGAGATAAFGSGVMELSLWAEAGSENPTTSSAVAAARRTAVDVKLLAMPAISSASRPSAKAPIGARYGLTGVNAAVQIK